MKKENKAIIIIGANGFIGSKLIKYLKDKYTIYAIVSKTNDHDCTNVSYILKNENLSKRIKHNEIYAVLNLAWSGTYNNRNSYEYQFNNLNNLKNIFSSLDKFKINKWFNFSSIMEYELINEFENKYINQERVYALAKLNEEFITKSFCNSHNIRYISLVITNTFGPGEDSNRLINLIIKNFILNKKIELTKCNQLYSFIYIDLLVKIISKILEKELYTSSRYIIGDKKPKRLKKYIKIIYKTLNMIDNRKNSPYFTNQNVLSLKYNYLNAKETYKFTNIRIKWKKEFSNGIIETYYFLKDVIDVK